MACFALNVSVVFSISNAVAWLVEWFGRNPNCYFMKKVFLSKKLTRCLYTIFSNILNITESKLIGL